MGDINKTIWIYWHEGFYKAPEIPKKCLETWEAKNPGWTINKLSKDNLNDYVDLELELPGITSKDITQTSLSDIIRILLLKKYGGIWVDSTLLCKMPLDQWIYAFNNDFFAFSKPVMDRLVSSWFLIAKKESYIINKWLEKTLEYWSTRNSTDQYFWFHNQFNELYESDPSFKQLWDNTPKVSANAPHYFTPYEKVFFETINEEKINRIEKVQSPVFKLTYKYDQNKEKENTILNYLLTKELKITPIKILVVWYGSFFQNGTVGDFLAVKALTDFLHEKKFDFSCVTYKPFEGINCKALTLDEANPEEYDVMIFCCGPILKMHPKLNSLFEKFQDLYKIGVSVSMFPKDHFNYYNPFDYILSRENENEIYEDLAILANTTAEKKKTDNRLTVGMVLRNEQAEYGVENCKSVETNSYLMKLATSLTQSNNGSIIVIDNHLETSGLTPQEIENNYLQCDIILTTRFHGSIMAIRKNIPLIAIDQISNGAKVHKLVSQTGYPFVWKINDVTYEELEKTALSLLNNEHQDALLAAKNKSELKANVTLNQLYAHLIAFSRTTFK